VTLICFDFAKLSAWLQTSDKYFPYKFLGKNELEISVLSEFLKSDKPITQSKKCAGLSGKALIFPAVTFSKCTSEYELYAMPLLKNAEASIMIISIGSTAFSISCTAVIVPENPPPIMPIFLILVRFLYL